MLEVWDSLRPSPFSEQLNNEFDEYVSIITQGAYAVLLYSTCSLFIEINAAPEGYRSVNDALM